MNIEEKGENNELHRKSTWVFGIRHSSGLNYLSIFMVVYIFVILKTEIWWLHICNDLLTVRICITKEFISTHSFWITLLACMKAKESDCTWKLNWEGGRHWGRTQARKKTQVKILQTESQNQNLFTCAVKSWHCRLLKDRARPSVSGAEHLIYNMVTWIYRHSNCKETKILKQYQ